MSNMEEEKALSSSTATTSSSSSSSSSTATSTSSTSQNHRPGRTILLGEIRQLFSLPESIIYYIALNPSNAEVYKKLIRTCKYFYNKNPFLVINQLFFYITENGEKEWRISMKNEIRDRGDIIDMEKLQLKLWVSYDFSVAPSAEEIHSHWIDNSYENIAASIVSKIYRCDAVRIYFQLQNIKFDDFLLLVSNVEDLTVIWSTIYEEDDEESEVMFEKIIEKLPKVRKLHFDYSCECFSSDTVAELLKIEHFGNISSLKLDNIPEVFDAKVLFQAIKLKHKNMKINLDYVGGISEEFMQQLNEIVDEIISAKVLTYMPPRIDYSELDQHKSKKINDIRKNIMHSDTKF